jgi:hypothetical protein
MTPQESRTTAVEIIDANNVVVGTATTLPDGSFTCTVPVALGEHTFIARSANETSNAYTVNGVPRENVVDDFEDWPFQYFRPRVTLIGPVTQTSFTLRFGSASIAEKTGGGATHHAVEFWEGEFEVKPKYPSKKVIFRRDPMDHELKVTYYDKDGVLLGVKILGGALFPKLESDAPIYSMVFTKSRKASAEWLDHFTFYYN